MAKSNYKTWVTGEKVTAADLNEQIRDNGNEIWKGQAAGDLDYYASSISKARLPIGNEGEVLRVSSGVPAWGLPINLFTTHKYNSSWYGDSKSTGTVTFTANDFNGDIPNTAKALLMSVSAKWAAASSGNELEIRPKGSIGNCLHVRSLVGGYWMDNSGIVPLNSGEFDIVINGASAEVFIDVWGYIE